MSSTKHVEPFTEKVNETRRAAKLNTVLDDNEKLFNVGTAGQDVANHFVALGRQIRIENLVENRAGLSEVLVVETLAGTLKKRLAAGNTKRKRWRT